MQTTMDRRISNAYCYGTEDLAAIKDELMESRAKVGEFIDLFLDKYDTKMSNPLTSHDDPTWKLFRLKHEQYGELERLVKSVNYFIAKESVNV